jgi:hypothetical protein
MLTIIEVGWPLLIGAAVNTWVIRFPPLPAFPRVDGWVLGVLWLTMLIVAAGAVLRAG